MLGVRKSRATLRGDILEGSLAKSYLQRGILLPLFCCLVVDEVIEGLNGNGVIHWVCAILVSGKFPNTVSHLLQEALSMEQQW